MRRLAGVVLFLIIGLSSPAVFAKGLYFIGEDDQGVYLQTDQGDSWYISPRDLRFFELGEKGRYTLGKDRFGTYLKIANRRKFYVGRIPSDDQLQREIEAFNQQQKKAIEIKKRLNVVIADNRVLVPVTLKHGYRTIKTSFLLDTGASKTVIHRAVADDLSLKPGNKGLAILAGGKTIPMNLSRLDLLSVGTIQIKNMPVGIIDQTAAAAFQGYLGMDFLKLHPHKIDYRRQTIEWLE